MGLAWQASSRSDYRWMDRLAEGGERRCRTSLLRTCNGFVTERRLACTHTERCQLILGESDRMRSQSICTEDVMSRTGSLWLHRLRQAPLLAVAVACLAIPGTSMGATAPLDAPGVSTYANHRAQATRVRAQPRPERRTGPIHRPRRDYTVFLTATGAVLSPRGRPDADGQRPTVVRMKLARRQPVVDGNACERVAGQGELRPGHRAGGAADQTSRPTARCATTRCIRASISSTTTTRATSSTTSSSRPVPIRTSSSSPSTAPERSTSTTTARSCCAPRRARSAKPPRSCTRSATMAASASRGTGYARARRRSASAWAPTIASDRWSSIR